MVVLEMRVSPRPVRSHHSRQGRWGPAREAPLWGAADSPGRRAWTGKFIWNSELYERCNGRCERYEAAVAEAKRKRIEREEERARQREEDRIAREEARAREADAEAERAMLADAYRRALDNNARTQAHLDNMRREVGAIVERSRQREERRRTPRAAGGSGSSDASSGSRASSGPRAAGGSASSPSVGTSSSSTTYAVRATRPLDTDASSPSRRSRAGSAGPSQEKRFADPEQKYLRCVRSNKQLHVRHLLGMQAHDPDGTVLAGGHVLSRAAGHPPVQRQSVAGVPQGGLCLLPTEAERHALDRVVDELQTRMFGCRTSSASSVRPGFRSTSRRR